MKIVLIFPKIFPELTIGPVTLPVGSSVPQNGDTFKYNQSLYKLNESPHWNLDDDTIYINLIKI